MSVYVCLWRWCDSGLEPCQHAYIRTYTCIHTQMRRCVVGGATKRKASDGMIVHGEGRVTAELCDFQVIMFLYVCVYVYMFFFFFQCVYVCVYIYTHNAWRGTCDC